MKLHRNGTNWNRDERSKTNDNWDKIEKLSKEVNDIVLESGGNSNLEVVQARGGEATLNDRISKNESQLRDGIQGLEDGKMDKNTTDISVAQINKNKGLFDETYFTDEVKKQWTGDTPIHSTPADNSITTKKLVDKSVTDEKTTFISKSNNLIDKSDIKYGFYIDPSGKKVETAQWSNTGFIKVEPNEEYTSDDI